MNNIDETEKYIEQEVQIRLLNAHHNEIYKKFDSIENRIQKIFVKLDSKIESRFILLGGLIITSILVPVALHYFKLI